MPRKSRIVLAHDWLTNIAGGERVLMAIHQIYPDAPIYTSVCNKEALGNDFQSLDVKTTWLQKLPLLKYKHQMVAPLRALAFSRLKIKEADILISDSSSDAKGIKTDQTTLHINYCHTPTRYYWSHYEQYKREPGFGKLDPLVRLIIPLFVRIMRRWDYKAAQGVDVFIANSEAVKKRIKQYYNRESYVLFPPVQTERFKLFTGKRSGLVVGGRQVPYKRADLAILAANQLHEPLHIAGGGSENEKLNQLAGPTIRFSRPDDQAMIEALSTAEFLLFPGEEDAGIIPLEAMACGTPVIAYAKGGALESVIDGKTGVLFDDQTVESLCDAIKKAREIRWNHKEISAHAQQFSTKNFQKKLDEIVQLEYKSFVKKSSVH